VGQWLINRSEGLSGDPQQLLLTRSLVLKLYRVHSAFQACQFVNNLDADDLVADRLLCRESFLSDLHPGLEHGLGHLLKV